MMILKIGDLNLLPLIAESGSLTFEGEKTHPRQCERVRTP
jgi:hypothetical protein